MSTNAASVKSWLQNLLLTTYAPNAVGADQNGTDAAQNVANGVR
ncbi:hypothetical protein HMPREF3216_00640 [Gardnerella vaginalis]|uniref:Uncharacterized protein n=1 Tax=Gardnerella vaginalis TaxID=2702 RepID=A0A133NPX6_GARVA|nr:hypothetical protein HMPREF3216_00640 [Gardnerella vaginalis]